MSDDVNETLELKLTGDLPPVAEEAAPEPVAAVTSTKPGETAPQRLMFLTNRFNLLTCLGARLLQPQSAYRKYRPDTLAETPGEIPLIDGPPSASMIEALSSGATAFPVLLELGDLNGLKFDGVRELGKAVVGSVPLSRVIAVHLPDEQSMREHKARPYNNIHPHDELLRVTPSLFAADASATTWAGERGDVPERDWAYIDSMRGAVNAMRAGASSAETLETVASTLGAGGATAATKPSAPWLVALLDPARKSKGADDILFSAAMTVLTRADTQVEWSPRSILGEIDKVAATIGTKRVAATLQKNIEYIRSVLAGDVEFKPFKPNSIGLTTAKALLMVLLREDLASLLAWPRTETGADDVTVQTAAVYAGALRGLLREDISLRNKSFDDLTAEWATFGDVAFEQSALTFTTDSEGVRLSVGDVIVRDIPAPPPTPVELLQQLPEGDLLGARLRLCRMLGWRDLITTKAVWNGPVIVQARGGKTVVTGNVESTEQSVDIEQFNQRLNTEPGGRDLIVKFLKGVDG